MPMNTCSIKNTDTLAYNVSDTRSATFRYCSEQRRSFSPRSHVANPCRSRLSTTIVMLPYVLPHSIAHSFRIEGTTPAKLLQINAPAGLEHYDASSLGESKPIINQLRAEQLNDRKLL